MSQGHPAAPGQGPYSLLSTAELLHDAHLLTMASVVDRCWVMASTAVTMAGLSLMAGRKLCRKGSSSSVAPGKGGACTSQRLSWAHRAELIQLLELLNGRVEG